MPPGARGARREGEEKSAATPIASGGSGEKGRQPSDAPQPSKSREAGGNGAKPLAAGLYLVATPIGNAADLTLRALDVLRRADLVACEDTRMTAKLFALHGIATKRIAYHDHNAERVRPLLLNRLGAGARIALVSDAGTPLVSDPGFKLVRAAIAAGVAVTALPGPSAILAALVLSALPADRFLFAGFLPPRRAARREGLAELVAVPAALVFFESPRRLAESLADMRDILGDRPAAVARELTKLFEEIRRDTLGALAETYARDGAPKGEVVVVVGPPLHPDATTRSLDDQLRAALATMSVRDASEAVAAATGAKRRDVYARALALREKGAGE
jgi:16S rRNA (cytidine1402-2'-O)-methyltransferase